jgi:hypothetical protein
MYTLYQADISANKTAQNSTIKMQNQELSYHWYTENRMVLNSLWTFSSDETVFCISTGLIILVLDDMRAGIGIYSPVLDYHIPSLPDKKALY